MKHFLFALCVILAVTFPLIGQSQNTLNDSLQKELKLGVDGFKYRYHSPSIVVAIVHDQHIIFTDAVGYIDLNRKIPATIQSQYPILSLTKPFVVTMLMQLKQRGVLTLEDKITQYVPEIKHGSRISLLQLATHTSGLPRNSPADIHFVKQADRWLLGVSKDTLIKSGTKETFLKALPYIKAEYPQYQIMPYGDRHYSNLGFSLLGIALERAAKKDFATYVMTNICRPLQMDNSGFINEKNYDKLGTKGYVYIDSSNSFVEAPVFIPNDALYAGGMYASAADLAKFISFQFDKKSKVLSAQNKAMMQAFNMGWRPSYPFITHEGAMLGYRCEMAFNPLLKLGWVILTNTTDFDFSRINDYFGHLLLPIYRKKPLHDINKFTGTYRLSNGADSLEIYIKNGHLYSSYLEDILADKPLISSGHNAFSQEGHGGYHISYQFIIGDDGTVKAVNLSQLMWIKE